MKFTIKNNDLSNIGTIINGGKYTFNIATNGNGGSIGYINLTLGTWIVFSGGWCPCNSGYVEILDYYYCTSWSNSSFQFVVSGIIKPISDTTIKIRLTNWGNANATNWPGGYVRAIRIA